MAAAVGAPILTMSWHDVLFAHWRMPVGDLRPFVPEPLEIEAWGGAAWVGVVPFRMTHVRPLGIPLPGERFAFAEINVRTYVRLGELRGVWFLSLDGGNRLAARVARRVFRVPYVHARVDATPDGEGIRFESLRAGSPPANFRARYAPTGRPRRAEPGSLDAFLTDRVRLFAASPAGRVLSAEVEHDPWPLQDARADIQENTMTASLGLDVPSGSPHLLFARRIAVVGRAPVWR